MSTFKAPAELHPTEPARPQATAGIVSSQKSLPEFEHPSFVDPEYLERWRRRWVKVPLPDPTPEDVRVLDELDRQEDALIREQGISLRSR